VNQDQGFQKVRDNYRELKSIAEDYEIPVQVIVELYKRGVIKLPITEESKTLLKVLNDKDILDRLVWKRFSRIRESRRLDYINTLRFNKLERYAYTRLINAYRSGKRVSTKQLIIELSQHYQIPISGKGDVDISNYNSLKRIAKRMRWIAYYETHHATSATRGDCLR